MSQINNTFEYNGVSYEFDIRDAEASEKFEEAVDQMREAEKSRPNAKQATSSVSCIYYTTSYFF